MERVSLKPLFEQSARQGVGYGILFTIMSACLLWSMQIPMLSLLFLLLGVGGFLFLPINLAAVAMRHPAYCTFPALWMSGIIQFIGGALICAFFTGLFLIYISPDFLSEYVAELVRQLKAMEQENIMDVNQLVVPTPMQFVGSMFWTTSFFGSMTGLVAGLILPRTSFFQKLVMWHKSKISNL